MKQTVKTIQCIDCGEWFEVSVFDSATCRCDCCYEEHRRQRKLETQRERRQKMKMKSDPLNNLYDQ